MKINKVDQDKSSEDEEMLDLVDQPSYQEAVEDAVMKSASSGKRGRKAVPPQWSRVINTNPWNEPEVESFVIDEDLVDLEEEPLIIPKKPKKQWKPYFHPKSYW